VRLVSRAAAKWQDGTRPAITSDQSMIGAPPAIWVRISLSGGEKGSNG